MEERHPTSCPNGASDQKSSIDGNSEEWCVPIYHEVCLLDSISPTMHNLCDCMDKSNMFHDFPYRFSSITYNISDNGSRKRLQESLISAAKQSGGLDLAVASGRSKNLTRSGTGARVEFILQCACSRPYEYKPKYSHTTVNSNDECSSAEQQGGCNNKVIHRRRRGITKRIVNKGGDTCKFRLPIYIDNISYFVRSRVGYNRHSGAHPKPCSLETTSSKATNRLPETQTNKKRRERTTSQRLELNRPAHAEEEEEIFLGESGGDFDDTEDLEVREAVSSDHDDADLSANDVVDHDFSANDDANNSHAVVRYHLDPYEELNPLFKQLVDMIQANHTNERVMKGKRMLMNTIAKLKKDILAEGGRVLNVSSSRRQQQQATNASSPSKRRRRLVP